jgi:methylenetetrahydrofolate--tRNA-(uracil-5-)-methyltransferase
MRPVVKTPAHRTDRLGEIVCSNSLKSTARHRPSGLLKRELTALGSFLIRIAGECRVEAGTALAVDREAFAASVTRRIESGERIRVHRGEVKGIPPRGLVIVATGPLTSDPLCRSLTDFLGVDRLFFYDATAPVVAGESIDRSVAFAATRRGEGEGHYLNCPMTREEYEAFVAAVVAADPFPRRDFEAVSFFEACMPIDELARRGPETLAFGPMRPVGLVDPRTGERPYAVVQLRPENREATAYNLVGFQNRLRHSDQRRIFRTIPGLARAEFFRLGRVHRNTYLEAPRVLDDRLAVRAQDRVFIAGQLTGLEGYVEAIATGMLAGMHAAARLEGRSLEPLPAETALGSLLRFVSGHEGVEYRPTNVSFGLFPPLPDPAPRGHARGEAMARRAEDALAGWARRNAEALGTFPVG